MVPETAQPEFGKVSVTTDEYFGGCPECGGNDGHVDDGPDHWFICEEHRNRWCAGSNLFSSWRAPKTEADLAKLAEVMNFSIVEPIHPAWEDEDTMPAQVEGAPDFLPPSLRLAEDGLEPALLDRLIPW